MLNWELFIERLIFALEALIDESTTSGNSQFIEQKEPD